MNMSRAQLDDLIARFLEDALTPAERASLLAEVTASPESAAVFRRALEFNALIQSAARSDTEFSRDVLANIRSLDDEGAKKFSGDTLLRLRKSTPKGIAVFARQAGQNAFLKWGAAAAALIAITVSAYLYFSAATSSDTVAFAQAALSTFTGQIYVARNDAPQTLRAGMTLAPGDAVRASSNASVQMNYADGSSLTLGASAAPGATAKLVFVTRADAPQNKHLRLDSGTLSIQAAHQPADRPMIIATPHAIATVVGTRFVLLVDATRTKIDVTEGRVRFDNVSDHTSVFVNAGEQSSTPVPTPPAPVVLQSRNLTLWPFSSLSPWNMPLGDRAQFVPVASAGFDNTKGMRVICHEFSHPVFIGKNSDPVRKVFVLQNAEPFATLHVPETFQPDPKFPVDCLIDPAAERFYEFRDWKRLPNGDLNVHEAYANDLNGDGFPGTDGSSRISGAAGIGGLIRSGELKNGIPHAVALSVTKFALGYSPGRQAYVWPANTGNLKNPDIPSNLHLGTLLAIPPNVDIRSLGVGASGPAFEIAKALQDYGGYAVESFGDKNNALGIFIEPGAEKELPPELEAQLSKLVAALQTIANNSPEAPGGGGVLRRSPAPPGRKGEKDDF